jgi:hypothetical protein
MRLLPSVVVVGVLFALSPAATGQKKDVVILENGDRITGEVERLEAGILLFDTDAMGTVRIEWRVVRELSSNTLQVLELVDGRRLLGNFRHNEDSEQLLVETGTRGMPIDRDLIVSTRPVSETFRDRIDVDVSFGLSYASSTDIGSYSLGLDAAYEAVERITEFTFRSELTVQEGVEDQTRNLASLTHTRELEALRFRSLLLSAEENSAIDVDLRFLAGGLLGRFVTKTNNRQFSAGGGLAVTYELPSKGSAETNIEGVAQLRYRHFRFVSPERDLDTTLRVFPSLTDFGRIRAEWRNQYRMDLTGNLDWTLEGYVLYDSSPVSEEGEEFDAGVTTALVYSF